MSKVLPEQFNLTIQDALKPGIEGLKARFELQSKHLVKAAEALVNEDLPGFFTSLLYVTCEFQPVSGINPIQPYDTMASDPDLTEEDVKHMRSLAQAAGLIIPEDMSPNNQWQLIHDFATAKVEEFSKAG